MKNIASKKLVVGNIPMNCGEARLRTLFEQAGAVASIDVSLDRKTGKTRGFAIVEMQTTVEAEDAVKLLNGAIVDGRQIAVNRSEP